MWQHSKLYVCGIMFLAPALLVGCSESGTGSRATQSSTVTPDNGTDSTTFGIGGQTFTSSFAAVGRVELIAGVTATGVTAMRLFEETPSETPASGWMTLSSSSVTVAPKATGEVTPQSQALPLSGTATVHVSIMPGSSTDLCDQAEFMAEYELVLTTGVATVVEERYELGPPALLVIAQNEVTSTSIGLYATGTITGDVVDAQTGEPLGGAEVLVNETAASDTTDGAGTFTFSDLPGGSYTLDATLADYVAISVTVEVAPGEVTQTSIELYLASTVTGEVVDAQTGEFLSGVEVNVEETDASATTNASGAFTIDDAPAGAWTLRATQVGYVPATVPVTLTPDEATEVSIGLLRIGAGGDGVAVVLSWGSTPADLDLDDLVSFGPETVTISPTQTGTFVAGDYHVWIHNFSGQPEFDVSDGVVTLFAGGRSLPNIK